MTYDYTVGCRNKSPVGLVKLVQHRVVSEVVLLGTDILKGGGKGTLYPTQHHFHQNVSCIQMGTRVSRSVPKPQRFKRGEPKRTRTSYQPDVTPNRQAKPARTRLTLSFCWVSITSIECSYGLLGTGESGA